LKGPHTARRVFAAAKAGKVLSFELAVTAKIHDVTTLEILRGTNVVASSRSDPALARECVVLTAHLDHLGIGTPSKVTRFTTAALDNASGSAILLELHVRLRG